jgi:glycosyltransferase involved in cell wall biosynthesis
LKPQISILLPYFQGERWLLRSINSVRAQEGIDWELIIIDDGSVQSPEALIRSLDDFRIRLFRIQHAGKGAALNKGAEESRADIICFIDQDDVMMPGRLALQYGVFYNYPDVNVVYSDYQRLHDDGTPIDSFISHQASNEECLTRMARSIGLVSMQTLMMRKTLFYDIGGFSEDIDLTGLDDAEFFVRLFTSKVALKYQPGLVQSWVLHDRNYSQGLRFQDTRLFFLKYLSKYAQTYPLIRRELPYFKYHIFFMRGIYFLERGEDEDALRAFLQCALTKPFSVNTYYLILKSIIKRLIKSMRIKTIM